MTFSLWITWGAFACYEKCISSQRVIAFLWSTLLSHTLTTNFCKLLQLGPIPLFDSTCISLQAAHYVYHVIGPLLGPYCHNHGLPFFHEALKALMYLRWLWVTWASFHWHHYLHYHPIDFNLHYPRYEDRFHILRTSKVIEPIESNTSTIVVASKSHVSYL